ncbi:tRNA pseudouridine(55) synthase TruB [Gleimia europaea]|uniref:tRNA pseudouridine synthase B n=1 Tax=Gleimia europaea ACS-120-V-Col10b TaxID=883069 RepID=A0A9W5RDS8_9ACTO|nr:tRNA pseudouridine(55) synthase TruB [Gleimia europaea]EPD30613.1 tRNA pseudouridine(55) synthase [Gleimia europaea ACS-120-V-Col10b]
MKPSLDVPRARVSAADGLLIVDKPQGVTSHDVVGAVRRLAATRKVGHAGTLDPMATGVLVLGIGKATRLLTFITGADKEYRARVQLGAATDSDDADGQIISRMGARDLNVGSIDEALASMRGEVMQVPAKVSAIKVDGKRAHALHREGKDVKLAARPVVISRLERTSDLVATQLGDGTPTVEFDLVVECSSGTYVRAIARDLGEMLGTGAHLTALRRTRVGKWTLDDAVTLDRLARFVASQPEENPHPISVLSLTQAASQQFDTIELSEDEAEAMRHGNATKVAVRTPDGQITACTWKGQVRALVTRSGKKYQPVLVFSTDPL